MEAEGPDITQAILAVMIAFLMLGLGATTSVPDFKKAVRPPKAILIGIVSQFTIMPVVGMLFSLAFRFDAALALGVLLVACAPGGTTSNLFAYWSKGDLSLSISMTVASTIAAVGMMPLLLYITSLPFSSNPVLIPLVRIVISLVLVIVPVLIGLFIKTRSDTWGKRLEKFGTIMGVIFIIAALIVGVIENVDLFPDTAPLYIVCVLMQWIGTGIGYGLAKLAKLTPKECRTVSLETGIQNSALSIAIAVFSFPPGDLLLDVLVAPLLYSLFLMINSPLLTLFFIKTAVDDVDDQ